MSTAKIITVAGLAAPALTLNTAMFEPASLLRIFVNVPSQSVAGVPILQFNGDTGTTAYAFNVVHSTLVIAVVTLAGNTGAAGSANGIQLGQNNTTGPMSAEVGIGNGPGQAHGIMFSGFAGIMDASAAPAIIHGAGIWSTAQQVTSIQLSSSGGGNLGAGTVMVVVGFEV